MLHGVIPGLDNLIEAHERHARDPNNSGFDYNLTTMETRFYAQFIEQTLGTDFKGVFPFSSSDWVCFMIDYITRKEIKKFGHWDYADSSFSKSDDISEKLAEQFRAMGIVNPERIPVSSLMTAKRSEARQWEIATIGNKTTRLVGVHFGHWPIHEGDLPEELKLGSYDIGFLQSDQTGTKLAPEIICDLVRQGGFVVAHAKNLLTNHQRMMQTRKLVPLLYSGNLQYNLYQKI